MSVNDRLRAIEKRIEKLDLGRDCDTCGRVKGQGLRVMCGPDEPGDCPVCGLSVDAKGRAVGTAHADGTMDSIKRYAWGTETRWAS